ncbi:S-layer homology domain-containing protein [Paenibacillus qinlingensis]|uniref:SLH domain-containing protein n=1 Tax=Paenibacillus qinlingensis TaxID=1837343 RepID=A0ABU1NU79_9BACL|nr:S-layer homology domain-containing protein [Paenibacillus qinlingensis]MDR6551038.1 hypothetical protein [Paenibacillus qinlingensis]
MKKSLKVITSATMIFSMFASIAMADTTTGGSTSAPATSSTVSTQATSTKTSQDFTDLKDLDAATRVKFDAMISAGIFDGVTDTTFGLKEEMNRAQFAKVAALIMGLEINKDLKTSSFSDVKADDAANGYALPYIEALKAANVTDGYGEGTYNPAGKVTKEQLATFLVRVLGKDTEAKGKTGTDTTVSGWAQGYVALALELKLFPKTEGTFGGQSNATRDLLLTGAYEAKSQYVAPGKLTVTGAKAAGVQKTEVTFNKPVDTAKAILTLKKGSTEVKTTTKWSDDKKTATLVLSDEKLRAGDYTVNVTGLDAADIDKTTATFTAENEVLKKIEFLSGNDTIARSQSTVVKAKGVNQYGENASFNSGSYTVYPGGAKLTKINKLDDDTLAITLDTTESTAGVGIVSLSIVNNDQHVTASKNYKVGTAPILTKLELGEAQYSNSSKAISGKGDSVKFDLNLFDQYGGYITYDSPEFKKENINLIWNEYIGSSTKGSNDIIKAEYEDNGSNIPRLKLSLTDNVDKSADYTFTIVNQAATATGKISIKSASVATKIEIGDFNDVIAAGDKDVYIPIVAYDASGNVLSADDLTSDSNRERIQVTASGVDGSIAGQGEIMESGDHRGSIHLKNITGTSKGSVSLTLVIASPNATSTATKTWTVADVRIPDRIKEVTKPAKEMIGYGNPDAPDSAKNVASNYTFQYQILDQYGKVMDYNLDTNGNSGNSSVGTSVTYDVYVQVQNLPDKDKNVDFNAFKVTRADDVDVPLADNKNVYSFTGADETDAKAFKEFNKGLKVTAFAGNEGKKANLRIGIRKIDKADPTKAQEITYVEQQIAVAPAANSSTGEDWTYTLNTASKLFNLLDSDVLVGSGLDNEFGKVGAIANSALSKRINIKVTNASGDVVAVPNNFITNVTSSNPAVVKVEKRMLTTKGEKSGSAGRWYMVGNKAGTATITATYIDNKGKTKFLTQTVTVAADAPTVASMTANNKVTVSNTGTGAVYAATTDYVAFGETDPAEIKDGVKGSLGLTNVVVTDSYGLAFDGSDVNKYNVLYGLTFTVQHVNATAGSAADVTMDSSNKVHLAAGFKGTFDVVIVAPSGKTTTTEVTVK